MLHPTLAVQKGSQSLSDSASCRACQGMAVPLATAWRRGTKISQQK